MDNLVNETNSRLTDIIANLTTIKEEYEEKLKANSIEIDAQLEKVQKYKTEFFESKAKIEKMNADIEGFETDYQKLVERFKDDELANILIAANKEISLKIDERKRKIVKDKNAMNELVDKAENVKAKLVKLTAEKKTLEVCLNRILDAYNYYSTALGDIINYSSTHKNNLTVNMPVMEQYNDIESSSSQKTKTTLENDEKYIENDEEDIDIDEDVTPSDYSTDIENENNEDIMDDIEDEDTESLEPVDISDMVKDEEISDYDNEEVIEGDEHKIVIENENVESFIQDEKDSKEEKKEKKQSREKQKDEKEEDINIDVNFDDSLEDDESLYE